MSHYIPSLLIAVSLVLLALGFYAWRLTNSRGLIMNSMFASFGLLYAAYEAMARNRPEWAFVLPFFATMLFGGRAAGMWWRSRKEKQLRLPARMLCTGAALSLVAAITAYLSL